MFQHLPAGLPTPFQHPSNGVCPHTPYPPGCWNTPGWKTGAQHGDGGELQFGISRDFFCSMKTDDVAAFSYHLALCSQTSYLRMDGSTSPPDWPHSGFLRDIRWRTGKDTGRQRRLKKCSQTRQRYSRRAPPASSRTRNGKCGFALSTTWTPAPRPTGASKSWWRATCQISAATRRRDNRRSSSAPCRCRCGGGRRGRVRTAGELDIAPVHDGDERDAEVARRPRPGAPARTT